MVQAREFFSAVVLKSGKVLVVGGLGSSNIVLSGAELYDPTKGTWSSARSLSVPRFGHTATLLPSGKVLQTGKVLVIGGTNGSALTSCALYNPSNGAWSNAASTNMFRYLNGTTLLSDGKVLVTGGASGRYPMTSAEIYDPAHNTWTTTGSMKTPDRYAHSATLLGDGTVVAAGGYGQSNSCGKACTSYIPRPRQKFTTRPRPNSPPQGA